MNIFLIVLKKVIKNDLKIREKDIAMVNSTSGFLEKLFNSWPQYSLIHTFSFQFLLRL